MRFETDRCIVRPFESSDLDDFILYRNNMDWMKYQGFKGLTKEEYSRELIGQCTLSSGIQLAVVNKAIDKIIGDIYLKQERDTFWIGYTIAPENSRQGYAYEVVLATINYLKKIGAVKVSAGVLPENISSIKLLEKLRFTYISDEDGEKIYILNL